MQKPHRDHVSISQGWTQNSEYLVKLFRVTRLLFLLSMPQPQRNYCKTSEEKKRTIVRSNCFSYSWSVIWFKWTHFFFWNFRLYKVMCSFNEHLQITVLRVRVMSRNSCLCWATVNSDCAKSECDAALGVLSNAQQCNKWLLTKCIQSPWTPWGDDNSYSHINTLTRKVQILTNSFYGNHEYLVIVKGFIICSSSVSHKIIIIVVMTKIINSNILTQKGICGGWNETRGCWIGLGNFSIWNTETGLHGSEQNPISVGLSWVSASPWRGEEKVKFLTTVPHVNPGEAYSVKGNWVILTYRALENWFLIDLGLKSCMGDLVSRKDLPFKEGIEFSFLSETAGILPPSG